MTRIVRAAVTETRNAFAGMPASVEQLDQLTGRTDEIRAANVEHNAQLVRRAAAEGARIVGLGELFTAPYFALHEHELWRALAEDALGGPTITALRDVARETGTVIVAPIYERTQDGRRFNTAVLLDAGGDVLGRFRKVHIPAGANERAAFHETFYYGPSDGNLGDWPANVSSNPHYPVFQTELGRIAVNICYDRHFPRGIEALARAGAELVFSPAVTFGEQSRRLWELEFQVDAARHRLYIAGSNRRGAEAPWNVEFYGASHFAGPDGPVTPCAAPDGLVLADLDLDACASAGRSGWDLARDARPETYS